MKKDLIIFFSKIIFYIANYNIMNYYYKYIKYKTKYIDLK